MGKSWCDRIIFEYFQLAQAASKRLQTKPGLTSVINPYYISPMYFWNQLQLVVGSEEDVHIRREVIALYVYALRDSTACQCQYISGSKGSSRNDEIKQRASQAAHILFIMLSPSSGKWSLDYVS
uniref:Uncharacterized protein n=1 Tax=Magallana gigas TaxID=29159 RepID=A0A8W8I3D5_MAGGI